MALYDPYEPPHPPPPPDDGWGFGAAGGHSAPPPAWPYYWDPSPPTSSRRRSLAAIGLLLLVIALIGAGVGVLVSRISSTASTLNGPVVDVNVALSDGQSAAGTGIVLTSTGQVLTNNHVVENSDRISVQVGGATSYTASVVGVDPSQDIALIQLDNASGLPTASIGDSSKLHVGDSVTAVGNALGRGGTPVSTTGHVTALDQTITATDDNGGNAETLDSMIQFDATIQPGDSGGALYDSAGKVVGVDTAGSARVGRRTAGVNQGFAIPINGAMTIARQIASGETSPDIVRGHRGIVGVRVDDSTSPRGAVITGVEPGSPAETIGLTEGDVIVSVAGSTVDSVSALRTALASHKPGDTVKVGWVTSSGARHDAMLQLSDGGIP